MGPLILPEETILITIIITIMIIIIDLCANGHDRLNCSTQYRNKGNISWVTYKIKLFVAIEWKVRG